jgi:hypothetical protein
MDARRRRVTWREVDPRTWRRAQFITFAIAAAWGLDYLFTPSGASSLLTTIERGMPLWAWGWLLLLCGLAGLVAEWALGDDTRPLLPNERRARWGWVSSTAHTILFGAFFALACSSLLDIATRDEPGFYGWRTPALWFGFAWLNKQFVRRIGGQR